MKTPQTKAEKAATFKAYRKELATHPELHRCRCGNVGYKFKSGDTATPVCKRCDDIENNSHGLKDFHHVRDAKILWDTTPVRLQEVFDNEDERPSWVVASFLTAAEFLLPRIESWIDDSDEVPICDDCGGSVMAHKDMCPITVHGHGHYKLDLLKEVREETV